MNAVLERNAPAGALPAAAEDRDISPVFSYLKNPSLVDFPKHLSAVFFVSGCNLSCGFCHNAELMGRRRTGMTWNKLHSACDSFRNMWVNGAVITGGEPTIHPRVHELIDLLRGKNWQLKLDTNGAMPDAIERCLPTVDYVALDVKTSLSAYPELTGLSDPQRIRRSIELIMEQASDYEFRITLIEAHHTPRRLDELAELVRGAKRLAVQPFIPASTLPRLEFRGMKRTSPEYLRSAAVRFRQTVSEVIVRGAV